MRIFYRSGVATLLACAALLVACGDSTPVTGTGFETDRAPREERAGAPAGEDDLPETSDRAPSESDDRSTDATATGDGSLVEGDFVVPAQSILELQFSIPRQTGGTALIYDSAGHLVTAGHATDNNFVGEVFVDGQSIAVTIIGDDLPFTNLAVLRADATLPPPVSFSSAVSSEGETVLAAGWVNGALNTTAGQILGTQARVVGLGGAGAQWDVLLTVTALKLAIPVASSGGALLNQTGEVVGMILGAGAGATFALPPSEVQAIADVIIACGCDFPRPDFGAIDVITIGAENQGGVPPLAAGAILGGVVPGSPFAEAGLMAGDIILTFDDVTIHESLWYHTALKEFAPGETVQVTYWRAGEVRFADVTSVLRER